MKINKITIRSREKSTEYFLDNNIYSRILPKFVDFRISQKRELRCWELTMLTLLTSDRSNKKNKKRMLEISTTEDTPSFISLSMQLNWLKQVHNP